MLSMHDVNIVEGLTQALNNFRIMVHGGGFGRAGLEEALKQAGRSSDTLVTELAASRIALQAHTTALIDHTAALHTENETTERYIVALREHTRTLEEARHTFARHANMLENASYSGGYRGF